MHPSRSLKRSHELFVCERVRVCVCVSVCGGVLVCVCACVRACVREYAFVHVFVHVRVRDSCICLHAHKLRGDPERHLRTRTSGRHPANGRRYPNRNGIRRIRPTVFR